MNRPALEKLSALLRAQPEQPDPRGQGFHLAAWVSTQRGKDYAGHPCGTTACAVGLAALSGEFPGLRIYDGIPMDEATELEGWHAVRGYFGLTEDQAYHLFTEGAYEKKEFASPTDVADRIDALLKGWE